MFSFPFYCKVSSSGAEQFQEQAAAEAPPPKTAEEFAGSFVSHGDDHQSSLVNVQDKHGTPPILRRRHRSKLNVSFLFFCVYAVFFLLLSRLIRLFRLRRNQMTRKANMPPAFVFSPRCAAACKMHVSIPWPSATCLRLSIIPKLFRAQPRRWLRHRSRSLLSRLLKYAVLFIESCY